MTADQRRERIWIPVFTGAALLLGLLALILLAPLWPCPSCHDLDIAVFRCEICGGMRTADQTGIRKISFLKRWRAIRDLRAEGCRPIPLIP